MQLHMMNEWNNDEFNWFSTESIQVQSDIVTAFSLRRYAEVVVHLVDPQAVALDSVEITFKDQYMGRSEMWRLKSHLVSVS